MKLNKKALIFAGLEMVALVFFYIDGYFLELETKKCVAQFGEYWQMCAPILFSEQGWPLFFYVLFTWIAFGYLVSLIYKKWIVQRNSTERIIFDIAMIPIVILMPIILLLICSLPGAIWILLFN